MNGSIQMTKTGIVSRLNQFFSATLMLVAFTSLANGDGTTYHSSDKNNKHFDYPPDSYKHHAPSKQTLTEVLQSVVLYHPAIESRREQVNVNQHQIREARATYFPTVDLALGTGLEVTNNATTRNRFGENDRWEKLTRHESSLNISQRVFDGFETSSRTQAAKKRYRNAMYSLGSEGEAIGIRAVEAYMDVLRQRALIDINRKSVQIHEDILEKIKKREEAGFDRGADVYQAKARYALARTRLESQKGALSDAISRYIEVVGNMPGPLEVPQFDQRYDKMGVDDAIEYAMSYHPAVRAAAYATAANKAEIRLANSPFYPSVNAELSASQNEDLNAVKGQDDSFLGIVRLNYNIFRGGADLSRKKRAVAAHSRSVADEAEVRRQVRENIRRSFSAIQLAKAQVKEELSHLKASEELVKAYEAQFKIGTRRLLALLDAEDERSVAESNLTNNKFILLFEQYRLLSNMGKLLPDLGVKLD